MPTASARFHCGAAPQRVLSALQDLEFLASAVPGVEKVERLDERTALWTVRMKLGPFQRMSVYRGELVKVTDAEVEFRATGPEATVQGRLEVRAAGSQESDVSVTLTANGSGALRSVVDNILSRQLPGDVESFARKVNDRFSQGRPAT